MSDDLRRAVAMLFRQKGRRSMTEKEFLFGASIDLHWFPYPQAQRMLDAAKASDFVQEMDGTLKPTFDVSAEEIPVGFRPDKGMLDAPMTRDEALLPRLMAEAEARGIKKRDFIAQCNRVQDRMDVDIEVASLLILSESGVDVSPWMEGARSLVRER